MTMTAAPRETRKVRAKLNLPAMIGGRRLPAGSVVELDAADYAALKDRKRGGVHMCEKVAG